MEFFRFLLCAVALTAVALPARAGGVAVSPPTGDAGDDFLTALEESIARVVRESGREVTEEPGSCTVRSSAVKMPEGLGLKLSIACPPDDEEIRETRVASPASALPQARDMVRALLREVPAAPVPEPPAPPKPPPAAAKPKRGPKVGPEVGPPHPLSERDLQVMLQPSRDRDWRWGYGRTIFLSLAIHGGATALSSALFGIGLAISRLGRGGHGDDDDDDIEEHKQEDIEHWRNMATFALPGLGFIEVFVSSLAVTATSNRSRFFRAKYGPVLLGTFIGWGIALGTTMGLSAREHDELFVALPIVAYAVLPPVGATIGFAFAREDRPTIRSRETTEEHPRRIGSIGVEWLPPSPVAISVPGRRRQILGVNLIGARF